MSSFAYSDEVISLDQTVQSMENQRVILEDLDQENADQITLRINIREITSEEIIQVRNARFNLFLVIPPSVEISWTMIINGQENFGAFPDEYKEGDIINILGRYELHILNINAYQTLQDRSVDLRLNRFQNLEDIIPINIMLP